MNFKYLTDNLKISYIQRPNKYVAKTLHYYIKKYYVSCILRKILIIYENYKLNYLNKI